MLVRTILAEEMVGRDYIPRRSQLAGEMHCLLSTTHSLARIITVIVLCASVSLDQPIVLLHLLHNIISVILTRWSTLHNLFKIFCLSFESLKHVHLI